MLVQCLLIWLTFLLVEGFACPLDFGQNLGTFGFPDVAFGTQIALDQAAGDALHQFLNAAETAGPHDVLG